MNRDEMIRVIQLWKPDTERGEIIDRALFVYHQMLKATKTGSKIYIDDATTSIMEIKDVEPSPRAIIDNLAKKMRPPRFAKQFSFSMDYILKVRSNKAPISRRFAIELYNRYGYSIEFWLSENKNLTYNWLLEDVQANGKTTGKRRYKKDTD